MMKSNFKKNWNKMIMITGMIKINIMKFVYSLFFIFLIIGCDTSAEESEPRVNCGEIVRKYHMNTTQQEGNPCGDDEPNTPFGEYAFIVKNDLTGNEKHFCVNLSEFVSYNLGSIYCDKYTTDGW